MATKKSASSLISLSPNPANEEIKLFNDSNKKLKDLKIYDMNGRELKTATLLGVKSEMIINISSLSSGLYLVKVSDNEGGFGLKRLIKK